MLFLGPGGIRNHQIIAFSLAYFVVISGSLALMGAAAWVMRPGSRARGKTNTAVVEEKP